MKKILLLFIIAMVCMANSDCRGGSFEVDEQVYLVVDKGCNVSSHFNPLHNDGWSVETDYFVTFKNVKTGHTFVHEFSNGKEYYGFVKCKKYRCRRFYEDNVYK